jgi:threonine dehydrogenase-like Zn-dependent dehydrogenase
MKAVAVIPGRPGSARVVDAPEPAASEGALLVEMVAIGVCGTDREIASGSYGWAPKGSEYLIIGHESLGRVLEAPQGSGFTRGDLVVGVVRRPDPVPCASCAVGEWDMCRNGLYTERGIKERHGFCSERYRLELEFAVAVDARLGELGVLLEPASVVAKAWEQTERIERRAQLSPRRVLVTGAGPIGLLAALMGRQRGYEVHVLDRIGTGPKPGLVRDLGATYHTDLASLAPLEGHVDIVVECTGASTLVLEAAAIAGPNGIVCLTGVSSGHRKIAVDVAGMSRELVLENGVAFGSVNANLRHYKAGAQALVEADHGWLRRMITRRLPMSRWVEALTPEASDVKTIVVPERAV